jgi:urease accessory protein
MTRRPWIPLAAALALGAPLLASAHVGDGAHAAHSAADAFGLGFAHPFTGLDHLAAMVMVGWWSTLSNEAPARRMGAVPLAFAAALLAGALLGISGLQSPVVEPAIAASLLVTGLLVATGTRLPWPVGLPLVAAFGLCHGVAHGVELSGPHAGASLTGMVLATALLHLVGMAAGLGLRATTIRHRVWAAVAGAAVAVSGTAMLVAR